MSLRTTYRSQRLFYQKVTSRSFCRSSFPNRTRSAGLRFGENGAFCGESIFSVNTRNSSQASYRLRRVFYKNSSCAHSAAPRFQPTNALLVCGLRRREMRNKCIFSVKTRHSFILSKKECHPPAPLLILSKSNPLALGFDLVRNGGCGVCFFILIPGKAPESRWFRGFSLSKKSKTFFDSLASPCGRGG